MDTVAAETGSVTAESTSEMLLGYVEVERFGRVSLFG